MPARRGLVGIGAGLRGDWELGLFALVDVGLKDAREAAGDAGEGGREAAHGALDAADDRRAQAVAMGRDLAILTSDIARLQRRLDFERDPGIRSDIRREIDRFGTGCDDFGR